MSELSHLDVPFAVPFTHRLRFTADVSRDDFRVLADLLDGGAAGSAKVLLIAEREVAVSSDRVEQLESRLAKLPGATLVEDPVIVAGGESVKNDSGCVEQVLRKINENDLDRRSYIVAVGGGAMLDAVGYAAAIAHRGIRLIRLPTTTLAQGDSGVGVKNAINFFGKKNWVGTFAVPWAVINDTALLETLPDRDFCSGFSEAVKVSLLKSREDFEWLCDNADAIRRREVSVSNQAIAKSCRMHLKHITEGGDPFEMLEARPLDFGHWSAHKLESFTNYSLRHGEAVAIGVAIDCFYSHLSLGFPLESVMKVCECLQGFGLSLWHEAVMPYDRLIAGLEEFRQHLGGRLTITMLRDVGSTVNVHEIDHGQMERAIEMLLESVKLAESR